MSTYKPVDLSNVVKGSIRVTTATEAPANPSVGDAWINTTPGVMTFADVQEALDGKVEGTMKIVASATQPTGMANGDIWIDIS